MSVSIVLCVWLAGCTVAQAPPAGVFPKTLPSVAEPAAVNAAAAMKEKWNCQRIERAIINLVGVMQASKERAEKEQEDFPQTVERLFARISGPRGAGNASLAEFQEVRRDAHQLNDLLRKKGCVPYVIGDDTPAFLK